MCYFQSLDSGSHRPILCESCQPASSAAALPTLGCGFFGERESTGAESRLTGLSPLLSLATSSGTWQHQILTEVSSTHSQAPPDKICFWILEKALYSPYFSPRNSFFSLSSLKAFKRWAISQEGSRTADNFSFLLLWVGTLPVQRTHRRFTHREMSCITTLRKPRWSSGLQRARSRTQLCQQGLVFLQPGSLLLAWIYSPMILCYFWLPSPF